MAIFYYKYLALNIGHYPSCLGCHVNVSSISVCDVNEPLRTTSRDHPQCQHKKAACVSVCVNISLILNTFCNIMLSDKKDILI